MSQNELYSTIKELREYKRLKEEAEAKIAEFEAIIKAEMRERQVDKMTIGDYKLSLTTVSNKRVDSKALQTAYPDIYGEFLKTSTYERFVVS